MHEERILGIKLDHPLCNFRIEDGHSYVVFEQSLETTWGGNAEDCKKLVNFVFPAGHKEPNNEFLKECKEISILEDGTHVYSTTDGNVTFTANVRGTWDQVPALVAMIMSMQGPGFFDRVVKERGLMQ